MASASPRESHSPAGLGRARELHRVIGGQSPAAPVAACVWEIERVRGLGDPEIERIAGIQKGYVVREQLLEAGIGPDAIVHRLRMGRLFPKYRGVYLVGRRFVEPLGEEMAAVLYFRGHAVLSHRSAAALWGLLDRPLGEVMLTTVAKARHSRPGLRIHRTRHLDRRDLRRRQGLPLTSPPRTILDLATDPDLEQAVAIAFDKGLASPDEVRAAMERAPHRKGVARLNRLLETGSATGFTRSKGERRLRALLNAAELPQPLANQPLLGYVADFLFPHQKLILEFDSFLFHSSRQAFEHDRRRDQRFAAAGYLVIRLTWRQLEQEPLAVIARIAQAIAARAA
jgi:very-short-patch-repair endonuclease